MSYAELGHRSQVLVMRTHALGVLEAFPFEVSAVRLVLHGYNTTFRVDVADGRRFALRVNVNSKRSLAQIAAEQAWLRALAAETDVVVPVPVANGDGEFVTVRRNLALGRDLPAVLNTWLPGRNLGEAPTLHQMRAVGALAAALHTHAESWRLPAGTVLNRFDQPLLDQPNHLASDHELLTAERHAIIDASLAEVRRQMRSLFRGATPIVTHQDLHGSNLRWHAGRLAVFDFDDSGLGLPVQDLAIAAYYLRDHDRREAAMLEGYEQVRPLPSFTRSQYEAILAGRNLVLLNELFTATTAGFRAWLPCYAHNSMVKLRHWLDTGVYRHEVPGLLAA